tara:strand:- start:1931 stop:2080 length:150 start_codon:yes stop_codon:yes gene_type:complete
MKSIDSIWIIWLVLVIIWNYGWPNVHPIADVVVAVILSLLFIIIKSQKK